MRLRRPHASPSVGILSNEFFDLRLGRMGGFGWAARTSAECFATRPELGYRPLLLSGQGELRGMPNETRLNGVPLVRYDDTRRYRGALRAASTSLVLSIDYRPNFLPVLEALPPVPIVLWVRDPKTPEDNEKLATLRLPSGAARPGGITDFDCTSFAPFVHRVRSAGFPVLVTGTAPSLALAKVHGTYGLAVDEVLLLPNPLDVVPDDVQPASRPTAVFLGRLDPVKRPWLFVELARRFPQVDFVMLGQSHFAGEGSWEPGVLPANVRMLGHIDGRDKTQLLASASMLVNTAIHEGLAISFLEALHCGTPIVSCQDPESVTSRFGLYVGRWDGSGLESLDAFADAIQQLLDDEDLRLRLGSEGRSWVRATHTRDHFVTTFGSLLEAPASGSD
jgi:glycosyltransferase involved in cell wall biosynthesis